VDAHIHGGGGFSFNDADPAAAAVRIADVHRSHGTTTLMASLVTAPLAQLEKAVATLAALVEEGVLAGIHLEGPWLSPDHRGAHAEELLLAPEPAAVDRLMLAGRGAVRMVTIAPELEGGLAAIRQVTGYGAVAAIGHTGAGYDLAREAIAAGATAGTHVFNAMRPLHHREPGPALALLEDPAVFAEVIADGVHLHPSLVRFIAASPARAVFVTDAMAAACAQEGRYQLGGWTSGCPAARRAWSATAPSPAASSRWMPRSGTLSTSPASPSPTPSAPQARTRRTCWGCPTSAASAPV
jgi:N-acetylglucosamine-6-phosphate deacetylase